MHAPPLLSGFLSELIAVVHPSNSEDVPSGLHNLRHAATGAINSVQYMECTDMSAARHLMLSAPPLVNLLAPPIPWMWISSPASKL